MATEEIDNIKELENRLEILKRKVDEMHKSQIKLIDALQLNQKVLLKLLNRVIMLETNSDKKHVIIEREENMYG